MARRARKAREKANADPMPKSHTIENTTAQRSLEFNSRWLMSVSG
jgi:hypothetical protein